MNMAESDKHLFLSEINRALAKGLKYWAKAVSCPTMRFGATLTEAETKAKKDAKRLARKAGFQLSPPSVQSGEL